MKRTITFFQYNMLKKEFTYLEEIGELAPNQAEKCLSHYEIQGFSSAPLQSQPFKKRNSWNFVQILSIIGSVLIGLGVLSFVASNWSAMSEIQKFILLLSGLILSYAASWYLEEKKPITAKALYYIGVFIYGAEIFYIGQMFHLGGEVANALFAWSLGIIPLAFYRRDDILYLAGFGLFYLSIELKNFGIDGSVPSLWLFAILPLLFYGIRFVKHYQSYFVIANFFLLYQFVEMRFMVGEAQSWLWAIPIIMGLFAIHRYLYPELEYLTIANFVILYQFIETDLFFRGMEHASYLIFIGILLPCLFFIGHKIRKKSVPLYVANVILSIQFFLLLLYDWDVTQPFLYEWIVFIIGIILTHYPLKDYVDASKWMGLSFQFTAGLLLTLQDSYQGMFAPYWLWVLFGIGYMLYGLYLVYKNQLFGVFLVSVLIFRFYVDLSLVFMNKSIAFLLGGLLLLGLGYWFEKTRKGEKKIESQTDSK